jgi:hypothetical protein
LEHSKDGADAREIVGHMKERGIGAKVILFSQFSQDEIGIPADFYAGKDITRLREGVDSV